VEYNVRWGAPEGEVVIPGIKTSMTKIAQACIEGRLHEFGGIEEDDKVRVGIVGATRGYPDSKAVDMLKGKRIYGLEAAMELPGIKIYGAGIGVRDNKFFVNGGRLFTLVAEGDSIISARQKALGAMALIYVEGNNLDYRTDIGHRDVARFMRQVA
jgi:phosphoribosylamine--glycine ligase